jgi:hypothetical protein
VNETLPVIYPISKMLHLFNSAKYADEVVVSEYIREIRVEYKIEVGKSTVGKQKGIDTCSSDKQDYR